MNLQIIERINGEKKGFENNMNLNPLKMLILKIVQGIQGIL
jgi:hypothetical protein